MKNNKLEPKLKLTKNQVFSLVETYLDQHDPNELFEHMLNTLMKSERNAYLAENPNTENKGNGYRTLKRLGMHRNLKLLVPRDRLNTFKPLILGLLNKQQQTINELSYNLYGKGLTTRQIGDILEQVYGTNYSKSTISRISQTFHEDITKWLERDLDNVYPVIMVDALHIKVKRDTVATEAFYIVLGLNKNLKREILAIINQPTESALGWQEVLKNLKKRGLKKVELFVSDDLKGLDTSIDKEFPKSNHQKCVLHLKRNLANKLRKNKRASFLSSLSDIFDPEGYPMSIEKSVQELKRILKSHSKHFPSLQATAVRDDLDRYFTYLKYDKSIRRMIYTTNWIERFNKTVRRTTKIRNSLPSPHSALMLIGYTAMEAEAQTYNYPIYKFANDEKMNQIATE